MPGGLLAFLSEELREGGVDPVLKDEGDLLLDYLEQFIHLGHPYIYYKYQRICMDEGVYL